MAIGMLEYYGLLINTMGIHAAHEDEATPWNEPITNLLLKLRFQERTLHTDVLFGLVKDVGPTQYGHRWDRHSGY